MYASNDLNAPLTRDLSAARSAYQDDRNVQASREAHAIKTTMAYGGASEEHEESGGRLKAIVFGGLDGILTSFAIIAGAVGANLGPVAMLALGVSNVLADAVSMGAGEWLSSRSYTNFVRKEMEREQWELDNFPEGEVLEMIQLYEDRGMSREDAEVVITRMAKYKDFFVNVMMTEELSLPVPGDDDAAENLKSGFVMFLSFAAFGLLPVLVYAIIPALVPGLEEHALFSMACVITGAALFGLGAFKAQFHDKRYVVSGIETLVLGGVCAGIAFTVGRAAASTAESQALFVDLVSVGQS